MASNLPPNDDNFFNPHFGPDGEPTPGRNPEPVRKDDPDGDAEPPPEPDTNRASRSADGDRAYTIDHSIRDLLRRLGLRSCRTETSLVITALIRSGLSAEVIEAVLALLDEFRPLWLEIVEHRRTRVMDEYLDEYVWFLKNRFQSEAPPSGSAKPPTPEYLARHLLTLGTIQDFAATLSRRLR